MFMTQRMTLKIPENPTECKYDSKACVELKGQKRLGNNTVLQRSSIQPAVCPPETTGEPKGAVSKPGRMVPLMEGQNIKS